MIITGLNTIANKNNTKKAKKSSSGDFAAHLSSSVDEASAATDVGGVMAANSLFMLQEIDGEAQDKKEVVQTGFDMLEYLDKIKIGLLTGSLSVDVVRGLNGRIDSWRGQFNDPKLEEVLSEIELRAAVELAKLEVV